VIGGWVDTRAGLDAVVKRKITSPHRKSNPRTPIVQPVAQRYIIISSSSSSHDNDDDKNDDDDENDDNNNNTAGPTGSSV
jgi:hypothetical protein